MKSSRAHSPEQLLPKPLNYLYEVMRWAAIIEPLTAGDPGKCLMSVAHDHQLLDT